MLCAQCSRTLARIAPLEPSPRAHSQFARVPGHLGRRLGEGLWHRGHRGDDQARTQAPALRHPRARCQHQPRLRGVRSERGRRLGLLDRVARAGGQRLFAGTHAKRHTLHATRHTLQHSLPHVLVPHARERAAHDHEGLGPLRHAAQKRGNGRGQHARLQIGHQLRLALGKVRAHGRERV